MTCYFYLRINRTVDLIFSHEVYAFAAFCKLYIGCGGCIDVWHGIVVFDIVTLSVVHCEIKSLFDIALRHALYILNHLLW